MSSTMFNSQLFFLLAFLLSTSLLHTAQASASDSILQRLAQDKNWLELLHAENGSTSLVKTRGFYLSQPFSPFQELKTTLRWFSMPEVSGVEHVQCRYPARYLWWQRQLQAYPELRPYYAAPKVTCSDYQQWKDDLNTDSVSLVFASSYLGNPASMYGHLLLKFNDKSGVNDLIHTSSNFGASTPDNENMLVYVFKGIFGGYQGVFSQAEFYNNNRLYGREELRDLSEYRLNLSPEQVEMIVAHLYEVRNVKFQYFFFKENCGMQVADLIEIGTENDLYHPSALWVLPFEVVTKAEDAGLVAETKLYPSKQSEFYLRFEALDSKEKAAFVSVVEQGENQALETLVDDLAKSKVANALLSYYDVAYVTHRDKKKYDAQRYPVLGVLAQLQAHQLEYPVPKKDALDATRPTKLGFSLLQRGEHSFGRVSFKAANNDLLNINVGRPKFSSLTMLELEAVVHRDSLDLSKLTFVEVKSFLPSVTGLAYDDEKTWQFKVGYESDEYNRGLVVEGGVGKAFALSENQLLAGMLNGGYKTGGEALYIKPELIYLFNNNDYALEVKLGYYLNFDQDYNRLDFGVKLAKNVSPSLDVRAQLNWSGLREEMDYELGVNHYF